MKILTIVISFLILLVGLCAFEYRYLEDKHKKDLEEYIKKSDVSNSYIKISEHDKKINLLEKSYVSKLDSIEVQLGELPISVYEDNQISNIISNNDARDIIIESKQ